MTLNVPDVGEQLALQLLVNNVSGADLVLKLYTNDATPADTDVAASYTEATQAGYAAATLAGASWDTTTTAGTAAYAEQTFSFTTNADVYGYFITKAGTLAWSERFTGAPFSIPTGGGDINITPQITAS